MANLIMANDSSSPASEAYRMLRTNIQFSSISREIRVVVDGQVISSISDGVLLVVESI